MSTATAPITDPELLDYLANGGLGDMVVSQVADLDWPARPDSDGDVPTARAGVAARTLLAYTEIAQGTATLESQSAVIDLVSDLMHLADALGMDWDYILDSAEENQRDEKDA
jgi:hypothetical protein